MSNEDGPICFFFDGKRYFKEGTEEILKGAIIGTHLQHLDKALRVVGIKTLKFLDLNKIEGSFAFAD